MDCGRSEQGDAQCDHLSHHAVSPTSLGTVSSTELALAAVAALFFLRFWRRMKDRFFAFFAAAFAALAVDWLGLAVTDQHH